MPSTSPFGQYAPVVAAITGISIIVAFLIATALGDTSATTALNDPFWAALGVVFGGATAVPAINGHVAAQATAANLRLDAINAPPAEVATK